MKHFITDFIILIMWFRCVLTPNAVEFDRLVMAVIAHLELQIKEASSDTQQVESLLIGLRSTVIAERLHALSQYLGMSFLLFN